MSVLSVFFDSRRFNGWSMRRAERGLYQVDPTLGYAKRLEEKGQLCDGEEDVVFPLALVQGWRPE